MSIYGIVVIWNGYFTLEGSTVFVIDVSRVICDSVLCIRR